MKKNELYISVIKSLGLNVDENGFVYTSHFDNEKNYINVKNQKVCIHFPENQIQKSAIYFDPFSQENEYSAALMHNWLCDKIQLHISEHIWKAIYSTSLLFCYNSSLYSLIKEVSLKNFSNYIFSEKSINVPNENIVEKIKNVLATHSDNSDYHILKLFSISQATICNNVYSSGTFVDFCIFDKIISKEKTISPFDDNDKRFIKAILMYIFGENYHGIYSKGSISKISPHFHSCLHCYFSLIMPINHFIKNIKLQINSICLKNFLISLNINDAAVHERILNIVNTPEIDYSFLKFTKNNFIEFEYLIKSKTVNPALLDIQSRILKNRNDISEAKSNLPKFDESEIEWLKKDPRACYWFWVKIYFYNPTPTAFGGVKYYDEFKLESTPTSMKERYNIIKIYLKKFSQQFDAKEFYQKLKYDWIILNREFPAPFSWLKNVSPDAKKWVLHYIIQCYFDEPSLSVKTEKTKWKSNENKNNKNIISRLKITLDAFNFDKSLPLDVLIDLQHEATINSRNDFLNRMSAAWRQRLSRKKKNLKTLPKQ